MKTTELTPFLIVNFIRNNPRCIQDICYPNPGEPQLNELLFCDKDCWNLYCCNCGTWDENVTCNCDEDKMWMFEPPDILSIESPEYEIGEFLSCQIEDDKITFETD